MSTPSKTADMLRKSFKKRCNIADLKQELRKQYNTRLKTLRDVDVNDRRKLLAETLSIDIIRNEIKESLISSDYDSDSIVEVMKEIEDDLLKDQLALVADEHERTEQDIINNTLNSHLLCNICEKYVESTSNSGLMLCDNCIKQNFEENDLKS